MNRSADLLRYSAIALICMVILVSAISGNAWAQYGNQKIDGFQLTGEAEEFPVLNGKPVEAEIADPMPLGSQRLSADQRARVEYWTERLPLPGPALRGGWAVPPPPGSETSVDKDQSRLPDTIKIWSHPNLLPIIPAGFSSSTNEPAAAMAGRNRFQVGNWYAAYSSSAGNVWTHLSPFSAFPAVDGGFCCDQDALYDPSRNLFIWFLQYIKSGSTVSSKGSIRIALFNSTTAPISNTGWYSYVFDPTDFGGGGGEWFDYPHLALGSNHLYIAINVFTTTTNTWTRTIMIRLSLDELLAGGTVTPVFTQTLNRFNFTPVQGAKDVMYWATQVSGTTMQIFRWEEAGGISAVVRNITPYLAFGTHNCPAVDGNDWCQRSDNRINAGAISTNALTRQQELWFFWNVRQGGAFPLPYIEGARFRESDLAYLSRPLLWSATVPMHYIGAAPNARGDIAISLTWGHPPNLFPGSVMCIDDQYNGIPAPWECFTTRVGAHAPASNRWGDYLRVRPAYPADLNWIATAFTLQMNTGTGSAEARNVVFGRERDSAQYLRWFNR